MALKTKTFFTEADLATHIKSAAPSLYLSSRTSTVIPYDKLPEELKDAELTLADVSKIPGQMSMRGEHLVLRGAVSWAEASQFLQSHHRAIMTSPTEQLALVLAGVATSCTGERCFGFGNLRRQVVALKYLDHQGVEHTLSRERPFPAVPSLASYQKAFEAYADFKNAPFPRFEKETDLMIGTEGQLGVITEVTLETAPLDDVTHLFLLLPRWETDYRPHLELFHAVQGMRHAVLSCELLDANCMAYLKADERLGVNQDVIFLEIKAQAFEEIFEELLGKLTLIDAEAIFEISSAKFHHVRAQVPRAVFEENSRMGVKKMGTDCQVKGADFAALLDVYREFSKIGVRYNLFGHFGDAHLHFNFMPTPSDTVNCQKEFERLYARVFELRGSPFAEHGIGLLKLKFIRAFVGETQRQLFRELKALHDPKGQFFPQGFMTAL